MPRWLEALGHLAAQGRHSVLVSVAHTAASAPREAGAKMVVTAEEVHDTLGGVHLESQASEAARTLLDQGGPARRSHFIELYALGPMLEQCCGGVVYLHYERIPGGGGGWIRTLRELQENATAAVLVSRSADRNHAAPDGGKLIVTEFEVRGDLGDQQNHAIAQARDMLRSAGQSTGARLEALSPSTASLPDTRDVLLYDLLPRCDFSVALYGAGHVGRAIVEVLSQAGPCRINWIDSREAVFPDALPGCVRAVHADLPTASVDEQPPGSCFLVMSHSHALDLALCEAVLRRGDFLFLGLIGSKTKYRRFMKQLRGRGLDEDSLAGITCPIGIGGIASKEPGAIAVAVTAQLLRLHEARRRQEAGPRKAADIVSI